MLDISHHIGSNGLQALQADWRSILAEESTQHLFHQFEWYQSYSKTLPTNKDVYFFLVKDEDRAIAIWPLVYTRNSQFHIKSNIWQSPKFSELFNFDIICRSDSNFCAGLDELKKYLNKLNKKPWHFIDLHLTLDDSVILCKLPNKHSLQYNIHNSHYYSYISCKQKYATYTGSLDKKFFKNLQRRLRNLKSIGEVEFKTFIASNSLEQQLNVFLEIESQGWKGHEGTSIEQDPASNLFYNHLINNQSDDSLVFFNTLSVNNEVIASQICVQIGRRVFGYKMSYKQGFQKYSPGRLLLLKLIESCFVSDGITELNFMTYAKWHSDFVPDTGKLYNVMIYNNNAHSFIISIFQNFKTIARKIKHCVI